MEQDQDQDPFLVPLYTEKYNTRVHYLNSEKIKKGKSEKWYLGPLKCLVDVSAETAAGFAGMDGQKLIDAKLPCNPTDIKIYVVGRRQIHLFLFLFLFLCIHI